MTTSPEAWDDLRGRLRATRWPAAPSGAGWSLGADILRPPREWLDRVAHVVSVTEPPASGHVAPFETPGRYAQELRDFFRPLRAGT